jgi:anti-sigma B factor antagonist
MTTVRSVVVQKLPEKLTIGYTHQFCREIESQLKTERPYLVFDFSNVRQFDSSGVQMLLHCMEEVMKRNGDLKLAALPSGPAVMLELTRVDRLFEIFEDVQDAVESFYRLPLQALPAIQPDWHPAMALERDRATDQVKVAA